MTHKCAPFSFPLQIIGSLKKFALCGKKVALFARKDFTSQPLPLLIVKSHELFTAIDPALVTEILDWFRKNDKNVYKSAVSSLAANRRLRPVFVQKKSMLEQYAWILKTLQIRACDSIGEQILQAYLMSAQQSMLGMFCDGLGIPHDGRGSVVGDLPKALDPERLAVTLDKLVDIFDPKMLTLYLYCFNMQLAEGYPALTEKLNSDERLKLA